MVLLLISDRYLYTREYLAKIEGYAISAVWILYSQFSNDG